jgi:hypothetical protein
MSKQITMVFPNGEDTLNTTEDMVEHYERMGYVREGVNKKLPASAPSISEQRKSIKRYMQDLLKDDQEKENDVFWTGNGLPDANAMSEALGFEVSATVRNEIWKEVSK